MRRVELSPRPRFQIEIEPDSIYAIGDIHGCKNQLLALEEAITRDAEGTEGSKLLVFLGDYIDRGPDAAAVIEHLLEPPPAGFQRIWLCGNHETALLACLDGMLPIETWLQMGGASTLMSYGYDIRYRRELGRIGEAELLREIREAIPQRHQAFLRQLPVSFATPSRLFVHAGVRPGLSLEAQSDEDLLWIREPFLSQPNPGFGWLVIHGHTPGPQPVATPWRIGVDTGVYMGGPLTAVRLTRDGHSFLYSR